MNTKMRYSIEKINKWNFKMNHNAENKSDVVTGNSERRYGRGNNPNSRSNLRPWPKGFSGNPLGRPLKNSTLIKELNGIGDEEVVDFDGKGQGYSKREDVLKKIWQKAQRCDIKYVQLLGGLGCLDKK